MVKRQSFKTVGIYVLLFVLTFLSVFMISSYFSPIIPYCPCIFIDLGLISLFFLPYLLSISAVLFCRKQLQKGASVKLTFFKGWIISVIIAIIYNLLVIRIFINCCGIGHALFRQ